MIGFYKVVGGVSLGVGLIMLLVSPLFGLVLLVIGVLCGLAAADRAKEQR